MPAPLCSKDYALGLIKTNVHDLVPLALHLKTTRNPIKYTARFGEDYTHAAIPVGKIREGGRAIDNIIDHYASQYGPVQEIWHHMDTEGHVQLAEIEVLEEAELAGLEKHMPMLQSALAASKMLFAWKEKLCISSEDRNTLMSFIQTLEARKSTLEEREGHTTTEDIEKAKEEIQGVTPMLANLVKVLRDPDAAATQLRKMNTQRDSLHVATQVQSANWETPLSSKSKNWTLRFSRSTKGEARSSSREVLKLSYHWLLCSTSLALFRATNRLETSKVKGNHLENQPPKQARSKLEKKKLL
jgi:hypothetical protein